MSWPVESVFVWFLTELWSHLQSYTVRFGDVDKDRKLQEVSAECKALKLAERLREKAVEEVSSCLG